MSRPNNLQSLYDEACDLLDRPQPEINGAIERLNKVVEADPSSAEAYFKLGYAYGLNNEELKAAKALSTATDLNPSHAQAHWLLGGVYREMGWPAKAVTAWLKAVECHQNLEYPDLGGAHFEIGLAYMELKDMAKAAHHFREATERREKYYQAYYNLAHCREAAGDTAGAQEAYQAAIDANRQYGKAYCMLGRLLAMQKDFVQAVPLLQKAVELMPGDAISQQCLERAIKEMEEA